MNPTNNNADQILAEAEELLKEINEGTEALETDILKPIEEINALTAEVEQEFNDKEIELITINEKYLSDNERAIAEATIRANRLLDAGDTDIE